MVVRNRGESLFADTFLDVSLKIEWKAESYWKDCNISWILKN